jgi:AcrR family transcriptional regulator
MRQTGGRTRAERTKALILAVAKDQFTQRSYDRVSIRSIAGGAGVDPALVMRYFGTKDTLFAAAVEPDLRLPDLAAVVAGARGEVLARHMVDLWEGSASNRALAILLRSAVAHDAARSRLREILARQVRNALGAVTPAEETERRASLVSSQMLGVALGRYVLVLPDISVRDTETLVADIAPTLQRFIAAPLPSRGGFGRRAGPRGPC